MSNPYLLEAPSVISFSGGRTSGYMLYHVLEAYGGSLPDGVKVVFCNTGKERPETLDFVERCSLEWGVPIVWLEYRHPKYSQLPVEFGDDGPTFAVVNYATADREGRPLEAAITARRGDSGYLPNPMVRYCTIECKIKTTIRYLESLGWESWTNAIGFRADEPRRIQKLAGANREWREESVCPLALAGVTKVDVLEWWYRQPFNLQLEPHESNCDLCFLKGKGLLTRIMSEKPELAEWWIRQEERGGRFRNDRPGYAKLLELAVRPGLFDEVDDEGELAVSCHCTD